jgi:hypothetical protein
MSPRTARLALAAALVVGVVVRVAFLGSKPFWRDEAWVVLLLRDPAGAMAESRPVPLGFLWAAWPAQGLPLPIEMSLRWLPLCAGIALLPLLARFARATGAGATATVATVWLAAGLPALVYYSRELKPYGLDALIAVVAPLLAVLGFEGSPRARRALAACLALTPWLTFGALFPVLAVLLWGWAARWRRASAAARRDWAIATAVFTVSTVTVWAVAWRAQMVHAGLLRFWAPLLLGSAELSLPQKVLSGADRYVALSASYLFPHPLTLAALALAVLGALTWPAPHRAFLLWLHLGTAALCIAAAITDRYLLSESRLLLFAAPTMLLWVGHGLAQIGRWTRLGGAVAALPIALGLWWSGQALGHRAWASRTDPLLYFRQDVLQDVDDVVARAAELVPQGSPVLVSRYSAYAFQVYARGRLPQATYCRVYCFDGLGFLDEWVAGVSDRGWVIVTDEEAEPLQAYLTAAGFSLARRAAARGVFLWEITRIRPT